MQTLKQGFEERNLDMTSSEAEKLKEYWLNRLAEECSQHSESSRESIAKWLIGSDKERFDNLNVKEFNIAKQAMEYRYRILCQRYLGVGRERAYRNLITRLGSLATLRTKIQTWISLSRDRQRKVLDVLQEVLQELLQSDKYMVSQMACISEYTQDTRLKNALLFASLEEYCMRPIRNQPLLVYRFVNYLKRTQRGGLTQVPTKDLVRLVSEEVLGEDGENRVSLVDQNAIEDYQEEEKSQEQELQRHLVKTEFEEYLKENLGEDATIWLQLYLKGFTQDAIAKELDKPIKEIYRLREKIGYHAVRVFAVKDKPELVSNWLETSLLEHNLGLTLQQWEQLQEKLSPVQKQVLEMSKIGKTTEEIAQNINRKTHQVMGEWTKVYLAAQVIRSE
ncbi:HetZ-related protein 2 [Calothrix sp. CCY 0018]|uniref:HetZ-related protein 2 n=1 Tax=Calothrix sp. CCY 0018 TaxID=3103864 RepID=UPI0039C6714F